MKFLGCIILNKYRDESKYQAIDDSMKYYRNLEDNSGALTFYTELEDGDDLEYPLNDVLEKYNVTLTDYRKHTEKDGVTLYVFEVEARAGDSYDNEKTVKSMALLIGKRAYNQQVGEFIELKIKNME